MLKFIVECATEPNVNQRLLYEIYILLSLCNHIFKKDHQAVGKENRKSRMSHHLKTPSLKTPQFYPFYSPEFNG